MKLTKAHQPAKIDMQKHYRKENMACFVAPAAVAIVTTTLKKKVPEKYHIDWLLLMLYGGVLMLIVDHIANGEVVSYFPFFTRSWNQIWPEILHIGVPMTAVIIVSWATMVFVTNGLARSKRLAKTLA